jgi:hypothetical protein
MPRRQHDGSLRPYSRLSRPEPLLFLPSSSSIVLERPDPLLLRKTVVPEIEPDNSGSVARNSDY